MAHIALSILTAALLNAQQSIEIGKVYSHYKDQNKHYQVINFAINTQKDDEVEIVVIYKALYLNGDVLWSRPVNNWLEIVEVNGTKVPRFSKVE